MKVKAKAMSATVVDGIYESLRAKERQMEELSAPKSAIAVAEKAPPVKPRPIHASQWTGVAPYEIPQGDHDQPLVVLPGDYVCSWGGGKRTVMPEPDYQAAYGKPELSTYWAEKTRLELESAASRMVASGRARQR